MGRLIGQGGCSRSDYERREGVALVKKYCSSCAHLNPEGAKYCENCGVKLSKGDSAPIQQQAGVNKWKVISAISIVIIVILASGLFLNYSNYSQLRGDYETLSGQYASLQNSYEQLSNRYNTLQNRYNQLGIDYDNLNNEHTTLKHQYDDLNSKYIVLNDSFNKVLDANNRIRNEINNLQGKIVNYAPYDNPDQIIYRYTDDMKNFVLASISMSHKLTVPGKEHFTSYDYFVQDLFFIHSDWYNAFTVDFNANPSETIPGIATCIINSTLPTGQTYAYTALLDIFNSSCPTAPLAFKVRRGVCAHFSLVLTELYQCYLDLLGPPYSAYSVYQLMVSNPSKNFGHACVLIKGPSGQVAIVDWIVLYPSPFVTDIKVTFRSVYEETKIHQGYWGIPLNYTCVLSRNYWKAFKNNDEFYAWAQGSG